MKRTKNKKLKAKAKLFTQALVNAQAQSISTCGTLPKTYLDCDEVLPSHCSKLELPSNVDACKNAIGILGQLSNAAITDLTKAKYDTKSRRSFMSKTRAITAAAAKLPVVERPRIVCD